MPQVKNLEFKNLPVYGLKVLDSAQGIVEAFVAVFNNVDQSNERIKLGSCAASISKKMPKVAWGHNWERPIGKTLEAREIPPGDPLLPDEIRALGGLYVKGQLNLGVQDGRDALAHLDFGSVDEFSIGYKILKSQAANDGATDLLELKIYEWSPVLIGCNEETALVSLKSDMKTSPISTKDIDLSKLVHFKGEYLGDEIEVSAVLGVLYDLSYAWQWAMYKILTGASALPEKLQQITEANTEFNQLVLKVTAGVLGESDASLGDAAEMEISDEMQESIDKAFAGICHKAFTIGKKSGAEFSSKNKEFLADKSKALKAMAKDCLGHAKDIDGAIAAKDDETAAEKSIPEAHIKAVHDLEATLLSISLS
jgi:HK97 family phage prohead protease